MSSTQQIEDWIVSARVDHAGSKGPRVLNEYVKAYDEAEAEEVARRNLETDGYVILEIKEVRQRTQRTQPAYDQEFHTSGKMGAIDANYTDKGPYPLVCGNCKFIEWGGPKTRFDFCQIVEGPHTAGGITPAGACRFFEPKPRLFDPSQILRPGRSRIVGGARRAIATVQRGRRLVKSTRTRLQRSRPTRTVTSHAPTKRPGPDPRLYADPARLPEPDDHEGYDNLNNVRLVPEFAGNREYLPVKHLVEGQMSMPPHQFDTLLKKMRKWTDVEFTHEKQGPPGINRIIRRGRVNDHTNLFIDKA